MKRQLLLLIVLALGCADTGLRPGSELPAVVIREYYFDQNTIKQGQTTGVNLVIQNLGDEKARQIRTKLFRFGGGINEPAQNKKGDYTLNPPDESTKTPGESREFSWQVEARQLTSDDQTTKSYNIGVLLGYDYKSEGWSDLLATKQEQTKIDKNKLPVLRSGSTKGPVTVTVITPNSILYKDEEKITVRVDVVNGANGIVYSGRTTPPDNIVGNITETNKVKSIELLIPRGYIKKPNTDIGKDLTVPSRTEPEHNDIWCCKPQCTKDEEEDYAWIFVDDPADTKYFKLKKDYTNLAFRNANYSESLTLLRGKQKSYVCYFLLDSTQVTEQQIIPIRATAEYSYSTEDSRILVVEGAK